MRLRTHRAGPVAALVATASPCAHAHLVSARFGDFYMGLMHPLTALENALPWLALALLVGLQASRDLRAALIAFPVAVAMGAASTLVLPTLSGIANVNAASFVLLGMLVAIAPRLRVGPLLALTSLVGLTHGYDNGLAFIRGGNLSLFVGGVACAAYVSLTLGAASAHRLAALYAWGRVALRAAGSWIAAIGILISGLALAPA
jgi:urease accessory protein